ncbi:type III PLP-dependent enzyme [Streptomyces pactum]|nr:type III PLP-dependent enzyme [Streptomyces pactum]
MITEQVAALAGELTDDQLPAYLHDMTDLAAHAGTVRAALPDRVELYYAVKANPAPEILRALAPHVTGYEVASAGELTHVRDTVPELPLAFGGPGKTEAELRLALETGVHRIHVESESELRLLAALAEQVPVRRPPEVLLRVNLPTGSGALDGAALTMGGRPTPFGLDPERLAGCLPLLAGSRLRLRGFHAHLASGLEAPAQLALAERIVTWARTAADRYGLPLDEVNIGGGMNVDYGRPERRFDWAGYGAGLAALADRHPGTVLRIEPGRALTGYCGWYVTEVLDVRHSAGEAFAVLRGGTHHLRTPAAKQHDHPFTVLLRNDWARPWPRPGVHGEPVTLTGQLCTPKDVFARRVPVGRVRAGDRVAFAVAGAYAWNISHHTFLMHPAPAFYFLG